MRYSRTLNNRIFRLLERFRVIYNEKNSSFLGFFDTDRFASIQTPNLRDLASEVFRDSKGITPNAFANISILVPPENSSPNYQSGFQLNPGKFGI